MHSDRRRSIASAAVAALCLIAPASAAPAGNPEAPLTSKLQWRSIGPYIGGRVVAVAGVPGRNLFYFGGVDAGVWKSTDYGVKWENITDAKLASSSASIGAIAVAPSNPNVLYAGSGECDIRADFVTGDGVYKSTDAGKTWKYAGLRHTHTICSIAIDPHDPNVVYAASMGHVFKPNAERGVFKSTDGGKSWRKVLFVDDATGAIALSMDPHDPNVLYAAMWQARRTPWKLTSGGPGSGLYKTTDGGTHWTNVAKRPGFATGMLGRMGVSVAASRPNVVYAIVQAKDGGVFRSADAGKTWRRVNDQWKLRQRAFYYMSIFADPTDPNVVYAPEVDALFVSRNGGRTFAKLFTPHGDNHIVWIDPLDPRILLEGNDGGATVSTDGGKSWSTEHNQPTGQFYHISIDGRFPFHVYGAQQDEGSFEGPSASHDGYINLAKWHSVAYGESTFVAPQPNDPDVTYGSGYFSIFLKYDLRTGQYEEISPWPEYLEGSASAAQKYRFGWTHPILFSPANPKQLLVGAQYVLESDDYGQTWKRISPDLTRNVASTQSTSGGPIDIDQSGAEIFPGLASLAVSPLNGNVIWAGSDDGLVHLTTDGGAHWENVTPSELREWTQISSIEPSHFEQGTAYISASRYMWDDFHPYIFKTTDYGRHWTAMTAGLPDDEYVFTVRQDPQDADLFFAATKNTVYVSFDAGANWQPLTLNLPRVQVRDIAIDTREGEVAIATHGRSFWILDDLALLEQLTKRPQAGGAYVFAPQTAWLTHAYGSSPYAAFVSAGDNPPFGATVFFHVPRSYDGKIPVSLAFSDSSGRLVRRFALHLASKKRPQPLQLAQMTRTARRALAQEQLTAISPGMNRFQWDLRYPQATEVTGFNPPISAGGLEDSVDGPQVIPGRYTVTLDYGGHEVKQSFDVALDPRLHPAPGALAARLDLGLRIRDALDTLDRTINDAIAVRDRLSKAVTARRVTQATARNALAALDEEIGELVQLDIKSSEGSLLHPTKLRSHLAYLAADIGLAYEKPTAAEYAVFDALDARAKTGIAKLRAAIDRAERVLPPS
jgi:photosystem II stability/assembly factor-like uncharacterized protein